MKANFQSQFLNHTGHILSLITYLAFLEVPQHLSVLIVERTCMSASLRRYSGHQDREVARVVLVYTTCAILFCSVQCHGQSLTRLYHIIRTHSGSLETEERWRRASPLKALVRGFYYPCTGHNPLLSWRTCLPRGFEYHWRGDRTISKHASIHSLPHLDSGHSRWVRRATFI